MYTKNYLLLFLFIAFTSFKAQNEVSKIPTDEDTGLALYQKVVSVSGVSRAIIYQRGIEWVTKFYKNPKGVFQKQDSILFNIEGKARFRVSFTNEKGVKNPNAGKIAYHFKLECKEGKYRYTFNKIHWEKANYYDVSKWKDEKQAHYNKILFEQFTEQTATYFEELIANLDAYLQVGKKKKNDDW